MSNLERVRDFVADWTDSTDGDYAREVLAELDAHLKEDAELRAELHERDLRIVGLSAELAQVREAANAEMKASLGYQAELASLRQVNKQLLLTKAGAFKAQMEYAEENARLRAELREERVRHCDTLNALDQAEDEIRRLRRREDDR